MTTSFPVIGNRYQIIGTIATGGMAVVYQAKDLLLERDVAVKVLRQDYSQNQAFINSFKSEAKASAKLNHPNIITVYDFGQDRQRLFLVMEYVNGKDLKQLIQEKKQFDLQETLFLLIQACDGLGFAHQSGFVHCDVKPHNMLISPENVLKVTDFGIARALDTISAGERHDVVWGSPYYISPEQAGGDPPSPYSDVYSLGIIAYEMLTGRTPFEGKDAESIANMHRTVNPKPITEVNRKISPKVNSVIMRALSKTPSDRYTNGTSFSKGLRDLQNDLDVKNIEPVLVRIEKKEKNGQPQAKKISDKHPIDEKIPDMQQYNWLTILLSIIALIMAGGLIPFWIYVYFTITSLRR